MLEIIFMELLILPPPVLGINEGESSGFLAQIELKEFSSYVDILKKQNYTIEEVPRLRC